MPFDERRSRRPADLPLTLGVLVAVFASLLPLMHVVKPTGWLAGATAISVVTLSAGFFARRSRLPAVAVSLIEAGVWALFLTLVFLRDTALLWIIPTPDTVSAIPGLLGAAAQEITVGAAPLEASLALSVLIVGATGLLTIIVDHVVLTARMPLLAAIGLIAVSLIPSIAVPGDVDVVAFVLLAAAILFLMRAETRSREEPLERDATRSAGVPATAIGIGAIAVVITLVAAPLLPEPLAQAGAGSIGAGPGIDATLQLGDDLRRPREVEVLQVRGDTPTAPYLRATTLSQFDGSVWQPDQVRSVPLDSGSEATSGLGEVAVDPDIKLIQYVTTVQVTNLSSQWLPVSYPAVGVTGLDGSWAAVPYNRTVVSEGASTQGQQYEVTTQVPRPTLEQIRSHTAGGEDQRDGTTELPEGIDPSIAELAAQVTSGTQNDYDALIALQSWFRSSEFSYSLDAPVEDGFDGSGVDAVATFLKQREGYCVHFASAFAIMARTLGMPSRIVVGYLPGTATGDIVDRQAVFSVASGQLHAWPEVYFDGIGWIAFEPTNGLGVPTGFSAAATSPTGVDDPTSVAPQPNASASTAPELSPEDQAAQQNGSTTGTSSTSTNPLPVLSLVLGILLALCVPALLRELRRRRMLTSARDGDAAAAWGSVQEIAIDLGIDVPASETPRSLGTRLVDRHGAPRDEMMLLVGAIERASYAAGGAHSFWQGDAMANAAAAVRSSMLTGVDKPRRVLALFAPRSLIVRPGSVYAGSGTSTPRL